MNTLAADFASRLKATMDVPPRAGIVLGSGIRVFEDLVGGGSCTYAELPGFPAATVAGHAGVLSWGRLGPDGPGVLVARGRFHLYEGHGLQEALAIVELFKAIGLDNVILTNAAGGLRPDWRAGDLMLVTDHLNFQNIQAGFTEGGMWGDGRGFQVVEPYDPAWRARLVDYAWTHALPVREGVYVGLLGPTYETNMELALLQFAGADAVGMSTVPEVARAASLGMRVLTISCITNIPVTPQGAAETSHQDVVDVAKAASERMDAVLRGAVATAP